MSSTLGSLDTDASLNKIRVNHNLGLYLKVVASGGIMAVAAVPRTEEVNSQLSSIYWHPSSVTSLIHAALVQMKLHVDVPLAGGVP